MKKSLLTLALVASSMTMFADEPVLFSEDFEWLAPWSAVGNGTAAGSTVETDNPNANAPQIATPAVDDVTGDVALEAKGYTLLATCHSSKTARAPKAQIYIQTNYLKFGLTGYFSGITMPLGVTETQDACKLTFDWCSMRQGSGVWDPTEIVVILTNGTEETQFAIPAWDLEKDAAYAWKTEEVAIPAGLVKEGTTVTFRNADSQWPYKSASALRYFLDNIKLTAAAGVNDVVADNDATAVYYNLQGIQVETPTSGNLYIVRQGNKVSKQLVK